MSSGPLAPSVRVSPDALAELKTAVLRKHGRLYGSLQAEASEAIRTHARRLVADAEKEVKS